MLLNITPRKYQQEILETCKEKSCLVVLPTGIGKCMDYSEPLLFSDGSIKEIGRYFEEELKEGEIVINKHSHISVMPKNIREATSLNEKMKLEKQRIIAVHKIKADVPLLKIKTYAGAEIIVTPEHPLLTLNENLEWKRADNFSLNEAIATPSMLPEPSGNRKINLISVFSNVNTNMNCSIGLKKSGNGKIDAKELPLKEIINKKISAKELIKNIKYFKMRGGRADQTPIKKIESFSPELLYWAGLVIGEGGMYGGIRFYNEDKTLLRLFKKISLKVFGIKAKKIKGGLKLSSTALYFFVRNLFDLKSGQHSRDKTISDYIMRLNNKCVSELISGLYDAEGSVRKDGLIEFITASKEIASRLCFLLTRFGIKPRIREKIACATNSAKPVKRVYYRVNIEGTKDATIFYNQIGFKHKGKKIKLEKFIRRGLIYNPNFNLIPISGKVIRKIRESLKLSSTKWKDFEIPGIDTYERGERNFSHETLRKTIAGFKKSKTFTKELNNKIKFLGNLLDSNIYWDKIRSIEKIKKDWVYDITLEKNFNFIAGRNGGVFAHNTLIALMLTIERMKKFPESKVLFLAPTRPLAEQHLAYFKKHLPELWATMELFTGKTEAKKREELWQNADIVFSTPQCLENDVKNNLYNLEDVSLLIEDEAHRCIKNYSYTYVAKRYQEQAKNPRVLGLTASPGSEKAKIKQILENLDIEAVEIRTRESEDVKEYLQELTFEIVKLDFPEEFAEIRELLKKIHDKKIIELQNRKLLFMPPTKKFLLETQHKIMRSIASGNKNFNLLLGASACATAIKLQHAMELLETQTLSSFQAYLQNLYDQAARKESRAVQQLVATPEFSQACIKTQELISKKIEHPKLAKLKEIIARELSANPRLKVIVFAQFRETLLKISKTLNEIPNINARMFVGQAMKTNKKGEITGLSQREQHEILQEFTLGKINVLCASSIGEEGLDIIEVSNVIFYEPIPSEIRTIQRRGRTARLMKGKLTILMTKKTRDEAYYWSAFNKEKKMRKAISDIQKDFNKSDDKKEESKENEEENEIEDEDKLDEDIKDKQEKLL